MSAEFSSHACLSILCHPKLLVIPPFSSLSCIFDRRSEWRFLHCAPHLPLLRKTLMHRFLPFFQVRNPLSVWKVEGGKSASGTDGIKMIEPTYNGSLNFLSLLLIALPLIRWLLLFFSSFFASSPPADWIQPSLPLQCHPGSQFVPKRLRLTGSPMERTQSQPRGEREEGGEKGARIGGGRKVEESAGVSRAILGSSQKNCMKKKQC